VRKVFRLKQQPGKDVSIFGSGEPVNALMHHDLIDEYRLIVYPIIVGSGKRLFGDANDTKVLSLTDTKTSGSDVVVLS
jgi:dihydrofolate reductase